jgi:RNA polymerase primary sigma factor
MSNSDSGDGVRRSLPEIYIGDIANKTSLLETHSDETDLASMIEYHSREVFMAVCEYETLGSGLAMSSGLSFFNEQAKELKRRDLGYFVSQLGLELVGSLDEKKKADLKESYFEKLFFSKIEKDELPKEYRVREKEVTNRRLITIIGDRLSERIKEEINYLKISGAEGSHLGDLKDLQFILKTNSNKAKRYQHQFVNSNLRLVMGLTKYFMDRGLNYLDLVQEGNLGLMRAVHGFDYRKGHKFSTYATNWIRQSVTRAIAAHAKNIKLPIYVVEILQGHYVDSITLMDELGREPTQKEVLQITARRLALTKSIDRLKKKGVEREPTEEEIIGRIPEEIKKLENYLRVYQDASSLEESVKGENDEGGYTPFGAFIKNKKSVDPADFNSRNNLQEAMRRVLATLPAREEKILRLQFGFGEEEVDGWRAIGEPFKVCHERARQLSEKALERLRLPSRRKMLEEFVDMID